MLIRDINKTDIDIIATFEQDITKKSFEKDAILDIDFHKKKIERAIKDKKDKMLVMQNKENKIIGWIWLEKKINCISNETYLYIKSVYVEKKYRNKKNGEALINYAIIFAKKNNIKKISAKVNAKNIEIISLLTKKDFNSKHITMELKI